MYVCLYLSHICSLENFTHVNSRGTLNMHIIVKMLFLFLTIWETLQNANSIWIHNNYMKETVLNMFLYSYFEYLQIWLNFCMDDEHFSNITWDP
jgi:hypothetical protein